MGVNAASPVVAPPRGHLDPGTGKPVEAGRSVLSTASTTSLPTRASSSPRRRPDHLGAHRLADVDDVRPRVLRGRDDAGVDAALRLERFGFAPRACAAPVRRDDRRRHADQQDGAGAAQGLRPDAGAALRDLDGIVREWRRLLSLFATRSCAAATASCRSTSTCRAARRPRRRWSTACCSCRGKSAAPGTSMR